MTTQIKLDKNTLNITKKIYKELTLEEIHKNPHLPKNKELLLLKLTDMFIEKVDEKKYLEGLVVATQCIESVLIPLLINLIIKRLDLKGLFLDYKNMKFYQLNLVYLSLSHDTKLYELLEKYRKLRNKIIHKITSFDTTTDIALKTKNGIKIFGKVYDEIDNRLRGKTPIPVLTLYSRGWNDYRKQVISRFSRIIRELEGSIETS